MAVGRGIPALTSWRRLAAFALVLLPVLAPLLLLGYPRGHDWRLELVRTAQFQAAWADGQIVPFWAPDLYGGFGSPVFTFYAPLGSAIAAGAGLVTGSVLRGSAVALALILVLAAWGGARLARAVGAPPVMGALLVAWQPYLLTNAFVRNAAGEALGLVLLVWLVATTLELDREYRWGGVAACLALVVLAHNLTAMLAIGVLVVLTLGLPGAWRPRVRVVAVASVVGAALSAWFWLPVLVYRDLVQLGDLGQGKFDIMANLVKGVPWLALDGRPAVGWMALIGLCAGVWVSMAAIEPGRRRLALLGVGGGAGLLILMQPLSAPVWAAVPGLALLQFPWRLLGLLGLCTTVLFLVALRELGERSPRGGRWAAGVVVPLAFAAAVIPLGVVRQLPEADVVEDALAPEQVQNRMERATVGHEFLPVGAEPAIVASRREPAWRPDGGLVTVTMAERRGSAVDLEVTVGAPARLELGRWSFPGWTVMVGGERVSLARSPAGVLAFDLPAGTHRVGAAVGMPPARRVGTAISLVSLLLLALRWSRRRR